jgi:hypothetical protein
MPKSEAHLDDCTRPLRVRFPAFSDSAGGVRFVDGEALDPMPTHVLARLLGIGLPLVVVGPWSDPVPPPAVLTVTPEPPAEPVEFAREASPLEESVAPPAASDAAPASDATTVTARAPRRRTR